METSREVRIGPMPKGTEASQHTRVNDEIRDLQLTAFKSNSQSDRDLLMYKLLHAWSEGDLLSRELLYTYGVIKGTTNE